jgi:1,4-dihydroxy-2-naphthoate octaprenyltransferase
MSRGRRGRGAVAISRALASQVHPVFMLPAVATALFGAILAGTLNALLAGLHLAAVFFALYTAHVTDGYVDFYVRGEDDDHPLTRRGCQFARVGATLGFATAVAALVVLVDPWAALVTVPGWIIAVLHAPQLDTNPLGATLGYPAGISLALLGGYYVQAGTLPATPVGLAAVFLTVLAGIKVIDDAQDYGYDRSIGKRTVAVALGPRRARTVAYGLMTAGSVAVVGLAVVVSGIPPAAALAVVPFGVVALLSRRADPELATMLLIRGSYLFLAVLVAAVWFRPLV